MLKRPLDRMAGFRDLPWYFECPNGSEAILKSCHALWELHHPRFQDRTVHFRPQIGHSSFAGMICGSAPAGGKAPQIGKIVQAGPEFIGGCQLAAPRSPEFMQGISLAAYPAYQLVAIRIAQTAPGAA